MFSQSFGREENFLSKWQKRMEVEVVVLESVVEKVKVPCSGQKWEV